MKELLKQYAAYNTWASQKLITLILSLPEEQHKAEIGGSHGTLYHTVLHMWDAESAWWQRMKLHERIIRPSENFKGTMRDVSNGLISQSRLWEEWVAQASELVLDHVFQYQGTNGTQYKQPIWQMLLHVFNHGTYHRGQLVSMLRQLVQTKLPGTDFVLWCRGKK